MDRSDLDRRLIAYDEVVVRVADIDLGEHQLLQNREEYEIPEDTVEDYAAAWLRDDPFPPVILWKQPDTSNRLFLPIDGYTRCTAALRADKQTINALVVDVDQITAEQLAFEANARHGRQSTREFRLTSSLTMIDQGLSAREAAARANVPERQVQDRRKIVELRRRCHKLKITGMDTVADTVIEKMSGITLDGPFKALAELVRDADVKAAKATEIAREVRKARSEDDQVAIVNGARAELIAIKPDATLTKALATWNRFKKKVIELEAFDVADMVANAERGGITKDDVHEVVVRLNETAASLETVAADVFV